jgi:tetratricopeptide (TPR) repeat protein
VITGDDGINVKLGLLMRKGDTSFNERQYQEAIGWYEQVTAADPTHAHAFTMLAAANYMTGSISSAMKNFDKALEIEPTSLNALVRSGQLHLQVCSLDRADKDFSAVLTINSTHQGAQSARKDIVSIRKHLHTAQVRVSLQKPSQNHACVGSLRASAECNVSQQLLFTAYIVHCHHC